MQKKDETKEKRRQQERLKVKLMFVFHSTRKIRNKEEITSALAIVLGLMRLIGSLVLHCSLFFLRLFSLFLLYLAWEVKLLYL